MNLLRCRADRAHGRDLSRENSIAIGGQEIPPTGSPIFNCEGRSPSQGWAIAQAAAPALRCRLFATFRAEFEKALERMDRRTNELLERLAGLSEAKGEALPAA
jgi:hypothetical protein